MPPPPSPEHCPACGVPASVEALWCGACGERLAAHGPTQRVEATATSDSGTDVLQPAVSLAARPVAAKVPIERRRRWPYALAAAVVLVAVFVVARPGPEPLHGAAPLGWGDADGRDGARTGRVDHSPIGLPTGTAWMDEVNPERSSGGGRGMVAEDVIVAIRGTVFEVFDREDGQYLWAGNGHEVHSIGDILVVGWPWPVRGYDRRTGELRWQRDVDLQESVRVDVVDGRLFELQRIAAPPLAPPLGGSGNILSRLDPVDGTLLWERSLGHEALRVVGVSEQWVLTTSVVGIEEEAEADGSTRVTELLGHAMVDLETGTRVAELDWPSGPDQQVEVLSGDRGLFRENGRGWIFDLATGSIVGPEPRLDGPSLWVAGEQLVLEGRDRTTVLDRGTLDTLWTTPLRLLHAGLQEGEVVLGREPGATPRSPLQVLDLATGDLRYVFEPFPGSEQATATAEGIVVVQDGGDVQWRSPTNDVRWSTRPAGMLRSTLHWAGEGLVATSGSYWSVLDAGGRRRSPPLAEFSLSSEAAPRAMAVGNLVAARRNGLSTYTVGGDNIRFLWSRDLERLDAMLGSPDRIWLASDGRLAVLDAADGEVLASEPAPGVRSLSVAGEDALVVLRAADEGSSGCGFAGPKGCATLVERRDPATLDVRWTSEAVEGACGPATLAGQVVAIPVATGVVFLAARNGREVGRWEFAEPSCLGLGFDGERFLAGAAAGLYVGTFGAEPTLVSLPGGVETPPLILASQVLVGIDTGDIVAVDLRGGAIQWTHPLEGRHAAALAVRGGALYVLLSHGLVARLT